MDQTQFDDLTRSLGRGRPTRRTALKLLAGTALGSGLARLGLGAAAAACKPTRAQCTGPGECCDGARCLNGRCRCKPGRKDCAGGGLCATNVRTDPANCGACGVACRPEETCCNGGCRNLATDASACGSCGTACAANQICQSGSCCIGAGGTGCTSKADCCGSPFGTVTCFPPGRFSPEPFCATLSPRGR